MKGQIRQGDEHMTNEQKEILRNILLEKMQEIAEMKNNDIRKQLDGYKKELHTIYNLLVDQED